VLLLPLPVRIATATAAAAVAAAAPAASELPADCSVCYASVCHLLLLLGLLSAPALLLMLCLLELHGMAAVCIAAALQQQ
jgi:hypothetical protein